MKRIMAIAITVLVSASPSSRPAFAQEPPWRGHLATLQDAEAACIDWSSDSCLPYLAEAVAVADVFHAQIYYDSKQYAWTMPGSNGSTLVCADIEIAELNGQSLLHLALAVDPADLHGDHRWTSALLFSALHLCRAQ